MPISMVTASVPSRSSVVAALRLFGFLNAGTPLEMASTPVMAVQPLAKALSSSQKPADAAIGPAAGGGTMASGWPPAITAFTSPSTSTRPRPPTKR